MKFLQRVHIIPVGDDEVDRVVIPAKIGKADKIYLVTMTKGKDLYTDIFENSKKKILNLGIVQEEDLIETRCDIFNFTEIIQTFANIIRKERKDNNIVFFSLSTGGNLLSAAGMLACVLFGAEPYFCKKDYEKNEIPFNPEILPIPKYNIIYPEKSLIYFLLLIRNEMVRNNTDKISKGECLNLMKQIHPNEKFSKTSGDYNKLKFRYLDKLVERKYIKIDIKPRGKIKISKDGKFALKIFSIFYGLSAIPLS
jgi:hypothetical protein